MSDQRASVSQWFSSGSPWVWLNAGAVSVSIIMVIGLLLLIAYRGLGHFWPAPVYQISYLNKQGQEQITLGERVKVEHLLATRLQDSGYQIEASETDLMVVRTLIKAGNRDQTGRDFLWVLANKELESTTPSDAVVLERTEWGNFYGFLEAVLENGQSVTQSMDQEQAWFLLQDKIAEVAELRGAIKAIEKEKIGAINYQFEQLRLRERGLELNGRLDEAAQNNLAERRTELDAEYQVLLKELGQYRIEANRYSASLRTVGGTIVTIPAVKIVRAYQPNAMSTLGKVGFYGEKFVEFVTAEPREANTEGGIFPAIFGTVIMVMLMSVFVTPFGIVAAVYLHEYAGKNWLTRMVRIAVNNLAGVPSIVYGVFGLGFFVYTLGGSLDQLFYQEALPAPTFGTPGLVWASLTLALLTVPVVIVSTEEGLARVPQSMREGAHALGATKAEALWRTILPMASPAMMTGVILAVARAAGEVAPLMLVGVVKLAPSLPLDGNAPFLHLDRKFMHLGFHIYDVGFQSPNVEAARPLVYATALLLVMVILVLNITAIVIRNNLREKYRSLQSH